MVLTMLWGGGFFSKFFLSLPTVKQHAYDAFFAPKACFWAAFRGVFSLGIHWMLILRVFPKLLSLAIHSMVKLSSFQRCLVWPPIHLGGHSEHLSKGARFGYPLDAHSAQLSKVLSLGVHWMLKLRVFENCSVWPSEWVVILGGFERC